MGENSDEWKYDFFSNELLKIVYDLCNELCEGKIWIECILYVIVLIKVVGCSIKAYTILVEWIAAILKSQMTE